MMFEYLIFGVALAAFGFFCFAVGAVFGRRLERQKRPEPIRPVCPCGHTVGEHKGEAACKAQIRRKLYSRVGDDWGWQWVDCACTKYHGPQVINDEFFHPGIITK